MTRAQALEWGRYGINVNAICPGYIRTEINAEHWDTEAGRKLIAMLPRRRVGEPPISTAPCCCWWPRSRASSTAPSSRSTTA
jgi:NAD(P)-dependent dehydrogenase (short-subunit alcohol dehydrogenase family)